MKKTAIVTGSSRGIGFAIAKQLGLDGYNIVMVATGPQEKNQAALDELKTQGIDCAYVQANIGSADDRKKILDGVRAVAFRDLSDILKDLDRDLVKGAFAGEHFAEYFFPACKDEKLAATVRELMA